jgi:uncharacterized membrane protein (DUF2068 family)
LSESAKPKSPDRSVAIILIGIFKLLKALLLVCVAITAFHLVNKDLGDTIEHWARELRVDPGNKYVQAAISHALNISPKKLELVGVVTLIYAGMFGTEGTGLLLGKKWAEYMVIITTAGLMPIEVYEIVKHASVIKIATLAINAAAVIYLVIRVWNMRGQRRSAKSEIRNPKEIPASQ